MATTSELSLDSTNPIQSLEVDITVIAARNLAVMDAGFFGGGSSDPFVKILLLGEKLGKTEVLKKTLSPVWNKTIKHHFLAKALASKNIRSGELVFAIFDQDKMSGDDPMGEVRIPLTKLIGGSAQEKWFAVQPCKGCKKPKGDLHLKVSVAARRSVSMARGSYYPIRGGLLYLCMGWDMLKGGIAVDLDTSCVGVDRAGKVLLDETVYYADLSNSNGSIRHSGDEREGDEDLGQGDDEIVTVNLDAVPSHVRALFFITTVATPGRTFKDLKSAKIRMVDGQTGAELSRFIPALKGAATALFVLRLARDKVGWALSTIGDVDYTARDFGSLVPEIKGYCRDIVPGIKIDLNERVAIMRKGGIVRLRDYAPAGQLPSLVTFGLAWDVTDGVNIDLDASVIMLDAKLNLVDIVFFGQLRSKDGSVQHMGDEREGDEKGDDEKIQIALQSVHPSVTYMGFCINSYSGQELDDVSAASCHIYDNSTYRDMASYSLSNTKELDKRTALVMGCIYRDHASQEWCLRIISEPAMGKTAKDNVDELQNFLRRNPPQPLTPPRAAGAMHMQAMPAAVLTTGMAMGAQMQMAPGPMYYAGQNATAGGTSL